MARKFFKNRARDLKLPLNWLIGICGCADGNLLTRFYFAYLLPQKFSRVLLGIDLLLKVDAVTHLHELVGVARVTIFAGELASSVGIHRPGERHLSSAYTPVQQRAYREGKVFNLMSLTDAFAMCSQTSNPHQTRGIIRKKREGSHGIRLFFAILTRRAMVASTC